LGGFGVKKLLENLIHPYPRYGLATALLESRISFGDLSGENAAEILARTIENGLENFRLTTNDNPQTTDVLRFQPIKAEELKRNDKLVQAAGLSNQGKYLAPSIVTTDGDAKGTFDNSIQIIELLRKQTPLEKTFDLSRSYAPTTAKINNGKNSQSPPKGTLFEAACSVITTLTRTKPAAWIEQRNTIIIPDLPLDELKDFIELFNRMMTSELDGNLFEAKLPPKPKETDREKPEATKKKTKKSETAPKSEYRRPRIYNGNYPFAPANAAFGAVGLLAAIGKWSQRAGEVAWAKRVLESIAGNEKRPGRPLYVISYDDIAQVQFTHHVVGLSISGKLSQMIDSFTRETRLYGDTDGMKPNRYDSNFKTNYELFNLMASRFLQLFNQSAFQDFLSIRAEYSAVIEPLLREYFMEARKINREIVESARALGQWLNRTAYLVADSEVEETAADRAKKVRQNKAKILVEFESAAMSATTPQDMLHRISTRAGRLLQQDMPAEATRFMDETNIGEFVTPKDAVHLLIAYMRLRSAFEKNDKQPTTTNAEQNQIASAAHDDAMGLNEN
jgi:hypothetical protein